MALDLHVGELNGTTEVVLIRPPPPGRSGRTNLFIAIFNEDIANIALEVYLIAGTNRHNIFKGTIGASGRFVLSRETGEEYELNDPSMSIRAVLGAAPTTQPTWYTNWREVP